MTTRKWIAALAVALAEHAPACQITILRVAAVGPDGAPDAAGLAGLVRELTRELTAQADAIRTEILGEGQDADGKACKPIKRRDGLKNRQARIAAIRATCEQAEATLGAALPAVRECLEQADGTATMALAAALGI